MGCKRNVKKKVIVESPFLTCVRIREILMQIYSDIEHTHTRGKVI